MSETTSNEQALPPYMPFRTFLNYLQSLTQVIPSRIDRSILSSMSGTTQAQILGALRFFQLIDQYGYPQPRLSQLVSATGDEHKRLFAALLRDGYPYLFTNGFDLARATPAQLVEQLRDTGAGGDTVRKCMAFFLAAAEEADLTLSAYLVKGSRPHASSAATSKGRTTRKPGKGGKGGSAANGDSKTNGAPTGSGAVPPGHDRSAQVRQAMAEWNEALLAKFPTFDPAWPDEVKAKWFDSFQDLMQRGQEVQERVLNDL